MNNNLKEDLDYSEKINNIREKFSDIYILDKINNLIILDLNNIDFCPGPCKNIESEPEPIIIKKKIVNSNNEILDYKKEKKYFFKPYNGKKYDQFCYPIDTERTLHLNNVRMCTKCYDKYLENWKNKEYLELEKSAKKIIKKIYNNKK